MLLVLRQRERRRKVTFQQRLTVEAKRRRDHRVPQCALQSPFMSAFATLLGSSPEQALITDRHRSQSIPLFATSISWTFLQIHFIQPLRTNTTDQTSSSCSIWKPKRMPMLRFSAYVVLEKRDIFVLCMLFGTNSTMMQLSLRFSNRLFFRVLAQDRHAEEKIPTVHKIRRCHRAIG